MKVTNIQYYPDIPFQDYLNMPGVSYSSLSGFSGPPTPGMQLGTRVHQYINEPDKYDWVDAATVKPIAESIRKVLGNAINYLDKEVAFTATFEHNGMHMPYKGRTDLLKAGKIVVDIKILSSYLEPAIQRFGYDKQLSGYCLATGSPLALIVAYNKYKKRTETKLITPDAAFWKYQCVRMGKPLEVCE